jgi:hypothetical protein
VGVVLVVGSSAWGEVLLNGVGFGGEGLVHDEESQEFFTPEGELSLSRDFVHLERLMGEERMKAWESEIALGGLR